MKKHYDRIYAAIDLDAISHNMNVIAKHLLPDTKIIAVVKTDGYGHGAVPIAKELENQIFMHGFATATAEEAFILRKAGITKPILVLGYVFPYAYEQMIHDEIRFTVFREDMLSIIEEEAKKQNKQAFVHVKVDTGMGRIGIIPEVKSLEFISKIKDSKWLNLEGMFTHFAKADYEDKTDANRQFELFSDFYKNVEQTLQIKIPFKHCANSAAAMEMPHTHMDLVRIGIATYGLWPSEEIKKESFNLKPAFSLHSHIVYIKTLEAGKEISYGGTYITKTKTKIATIPVGYGDGYPRNLSNIGYVLIQGKKAPILGKVCMDQFMVDVTEIENVNVGDEVVLIGSFHDETITMEALGIMADRFNYELVCDIGKRVPRIYYKDDVERYAKDYFDDYLFESIT
ncbi:MAG: alanine racemase [Lachnospiraceae bacterium]|nr:alanine racemase [Lachnospiraceae bacterium]